MPLVALVASSDNVPFSVMEATCLVFVGGVIPRYGKEYDFRKVESSGRDDNVGSLDSCCAPQSLRLVISNG